MESYLKKKRGNTFKNIHTIFPSLLAKLSKEYNLEHFIHLSALGINDAKDSNYAKSKLDGEIEILKNYSVLLPPPLKNQPAIKTVILNILQHPTVHI